MKPRYLFISATLLILLVLSACSPIEKDFYGVWKVYNVEVSSEWLGDKKVDAETMGRVKQIRFEFLEDGKMIYTDYLQKERKGNWSLRRGEYLDIEYEYPGRYGEMLTKESSLKIVSSQSDKMAIREDFENGESIVYYLERQ